MHSESETETDKPQRLAIPDGDLVYYPAAFSPDQSRALFETLYKSVPWTSRQAVLYGKAVRMPRLIAWYADPGVTYRYSGGEEPRNDWTGELREIKARVEALSGACFNGALLNLYRDGNDSVGWHSDAEPSLGRDPAIASVSLGAVRVFRLRHKRRRDIEPVSLELEPGSLLIMQGPIQHHWRHQLPKTRRPVGPRINITFRYVLTSL